MFNTTTGNNIILSLKNEIEKRIMKKNSMPAKFDAMFGLMVGLS